MPLLNKKQILLNLITPPKNIKGPYWSREYKILNELMDKFPSESFWQTVNFKSDWDSMTFFKCEYGNYLISTKYKQFHHEIPKQEKINLTKKSGEDKIILKKPKTIREFLS